MNFRHSILTVYLSAICVVASAQSSIVQELGSRAPLNTAVWGVMARTLGGDTLCCYNSEVNMVPASITKVLTCGSAIHALGADYRFKTRLGYSGQIDSLGHLKGDLYIIGGGDPTIGSGDGSAVPLSTTFARWRSMLIKAGITQIDGCIIGDSRAYSPETDHRDWSADDMGFYYGSVPAALNFYENAIDYRVTPGPFVGASVEIVQGYPETPWMFFDSSLTVTGPAGSGDGLYYFTNDFVPMAEMRGHYAIDRPARTESCSNRYSPYTCAYYFYKYLSGVGLHADGFADISNGGVIRRDLAVYNESLLATPQDSLTIIGESSSATLSSIIKETLHRSDNFYAESILKALGMEYTESSVYDSCFVAERQIISSMGVKGVNKVQLHDGSGLARRNYISPSFFVEFLSAMSRDGSEFETWLGTFPRPGEGTLSARMKSAPVEVKDRIRMKSGSMNGVRSYAGYILPSDSSRPQDTVVFTVITNNVVDADGAVKLALDRLILGLVR